MALRRWNAPTGKAARSTVRASIQSTNRESQEGANPSSTSVDTMSVDPFFLDFGTSVNVNEDLRRVIRGEIQEIDESINAIGGENKKEETVQRQLRQDLSHSHAEMMNLGRCTTDQLDEVQVHRTFLRGLENTLLVDLVASSGILKGAAAVTPDASAQHANESASNGPATNPVKESYKAIIQKRGDKWKRVTSSMKVTAKEVDELFEKQRFTIHNTKVIQQRIQSEGLETVLNRKKREAERLRKELQQEQAKLQAIKLATHKKRTESGSNAQNLADLTKEQDAARRQGESEKAELIKELLTVKELEEKGQANADAMNAQVGKVQDDLQEIENQKRLLESHTRSKAELEEKQKHKDELLRLKAELAAKLEASKEPLAASEQSLFKAQELEEEARKLKAENDEKHDKILVPGRLELSEIAEEKEKLAKRIEDAQKSNTELQISEKEKLDAIHETKRQTLETLAGLEEEARALKAKKEAMQNANHQAKESLTRELEGHLKLQEKLRDVSDVKETQLSNVRLEQLKRREEKIAEATTLADSEKAKGDRLIHTLKRGSELFEKFQKKMKQLDESSEP